MESITPAEAHSTRDVRREDWAATSLRWPDGLIAQRPFVPAPPFPAAYGFAAAIALGLGLVGGFAVGLYALGVLAFGWSATYYAPLVQAHGQVQILGLAGLLILGVGALLLPGFWHARPARPWVISLGGGLVGLGLIAQLLGQPLQHSLLRQVLLALAAVLPVAGFGWAGSELVRPRLAQARHPAAWEVLLLCAASSLVGALLLRATYLFDLLWSGAPAAYGVVHQALIVLELHGFLVAATISVQLRLMPSLARTRPVTGRLEGLGITVLVLAIIMRLSGVLSTSPQLVDVGNWLATIAAISLFWATGLWRAGVAPTVQAPATLLPGRTRQVLRGAWAGLLIGEIGRATGLLSSDAATHAFTSIYLIPLILVVGIRMLPRVSAYPIRFPNLCGLLIWTGLVGGVLRAFGGLLGNPAGLRLAWLGGSMVTLAALIFAALAWSPWGVPTGVPRKPEVRHHEKSPRSG
jgi:hypothetical protein